MIINFWTTIYIHLYYFEINSKIFKNMKLFEIIFFYYVIIILR